METVEIEGNVYEVTGHADDGLPIIQGTAVGVHEVDENGKPIYDKDGYPKISVKINVLAAPSKVVPPEVKVGE